MSGFRYGMLGGLGLAAVLVSMPALAQTLGIGATKAGAVSQITATISKVVSESGEGLQMRKQTMGGTQQYIPVVDAGELAFGISNISQYWMARTGTGLSKGKKYDNLRLVATMMQFNTGFLVPNTSGIRTVADLKGKRLAAGFKSAPLFVFITAGGLATGDLTYDDVIKVPAVGLVQHWRMFMEGKIDAVIAAVGTGFVQQMNAKIDGGVRHISFQDSAEALKKMHTWFPKAFWYTVKPRKGLVSVREPVNIATFDFMLWTHKGLSDAIAYKVAKVMHQHGDKLKAAGPLWRSYRADANLCKDQGTAYHPGAMRYYRQAGLCDG